MNNKIIIKEHELFGQVRFVTIDNKCYAVASDIAKALGYSNISDAINKHCGWVAKCDIPHPQNKNKTIEVNIIPEGDIVRLISQAYKQSKNPEIREKADKFEKWIFDDIVPKVLRTGHYETEEYTQLMELTKNQNKLIESKDRQIEQQNIQIKELIGINETKDKEIQELKELDNKKSEQIEQLVMCVGLRDRQTKMYTNYIKNRLGIEYADSDYYKIRKALFKRFGVKT